MNYISIYEDLMKGKTHPLPCICAACVYPRYQEKSKHIRGRHYNEITFFIYWLMIDIKKRKLMEKAGPKNINKKSTFFIYKGKFLIAPNPKGFDRIPYLRDMNKILEEISIKYPGIVDYESPTEAYSYLDYLKDHLRRNKTNVIFIGLLNRIEYEIMEEHKKEYSAQQWEDIQLGYRIYEYVKWKKEVTRTDLLRHFSNKNKDDLDWAFKVLERKLSITFATRKDGKKITYFLKQKSK